MRSAVQSSKFKRDVRRLEKRRKDLSKLKRAVLLLLEGETLPKEYVDHPLKGNWKHFRDLHLEPDWLLIYRVQDNDLLLARTGSHADLFNE